MVQTSSSSSSLFIMCEFAGESPVVFTWCNMVGEALFRTVRQPTHFPVCESCRAQASMTEGVGPAHGLIRFCCDVFDFFNVSPSPRCGQVCAARKAFCAWYQGFQSVAPGCFLESRMVRSLWGLDALKLASTARTAISFDCGEC